MKSVDAIVKELKRKGIRVQKVNMKEYVRKHISITIGKKWDDG